MSLSIPSWLLIALVALAPGPALALGGRVFVDADGDAAFGPGDAPAPGVRVTNGREVAETDGAGLFELPEGPDGFVYLTRPAHLACPDWYRRGAGDFACTPAPTADGFFFAQISDVHAFADPADYATYSTFLPSWVPDAIALRLTLWVLRYRIHPELPEGAFAEGLRRALLESAGDAAPDLEGAGTPALLAAWNAEFHRPGSPIGLVEEQIRDALAEVAALEPAFVVNTGDLILEGNRADGEAAERWLQVYRDAVAGSGLEVYATIGNNELVGSGNRDVPVEDPRYGRGLFQRQLGPTYYSFDRGPYHFVALDTHAVVGTSWRGRPKWSFAELPEDVLAWLDADLAAHPDAVAVVVNHEPLVPAPPFAGRIPRVDDGGLLARHGVGTVIAGHTHANGLARENGTTHVTTGALSGLRWTLPESIHERGYRLWYAADGKLYSAWKQLGEPCVGFVVPAAPALHPSGGAVGQVVAVAADRSGPFAEVTLLADGRPVAAERLGRYFLRASPPGGSRLTLVARRADGSEVQATTTNEAQ